MFSYFSNLTNKDMDLKNLCSPLSPAKVTLKHDFFIRVRKISEFVRFFDHAQMCNTAKCELWMSNCLTNVMIRGMTATRGLSKYHIAFILSLLCGSATGKRLH